MQIRFGKTVKFIGCQWAYWNAIDITYWMNVSESSEVNVCQWQNPWFKEKCTRNTIFIPFLSYFRLFFVVDLQTVVKYQIVRYLLPFARRVQLKICTAIVVSFLFKVKVSFSEPFSRNKTYRFKLVLIMEHLHLAA